MNSSAKVLQPWVPAMTKSDAKGVAERDEESFTFDVPDDALERAASVAVGNIVTGPIARRLGTTAAGPSSLGLNSVKLTARTRAANVAGAAFAEFFR